MLGLAVSLGVIITVILLFVYKNNQKKVDPVIDKVESTEKSIVDEVKKV